MTSMTTDSATNNRAEPWAVLSGAVERSARRGRSLAIARRVMLVLAAAVAALFGVAGLDALVPLSATTRLVLLLIIVLGGAALGGGLAWCRLRCQRDALGSAERIDRLNHAADQPVVCGWSLLPASAADKLSSALRGRAEQRAADAAASALPQRVYPLSELRLAAALLLLAFVTWGVFALVFPAQLPGTLSRVAMPWAGAPPFSLTRLDPRWTPRPPAAGEDVAVSVKPEGAPAEAVELLRLDEQGRVAETFEMSADAQGAFHATLRQVDQPITFKLQTRGRPTRAYTIEPIAPSTAATKPDDAPAEQTPDPQALDGTTQFDPEAVARLTRDAHPDWPGLRDRLAQFIEGLSEAEALAASIDPADPDDVAALGKRVNDLSAQADQLAADLQQVGDELPPDAAATLLGLVESLSQMQISQLAPAPGSAPGSDPEGGSASDGAADGSADAQAAASDWLSRTADAAGRDRAAVAKGLGPSDTPTDSGTTASGPDGDKPAFTDPAATGVYDQQGESADAGPLPPAVMQRVPRRYREHIKAYFNRLADQAPATEPANVPESQP